MSGPAVIRHYKKYIDTSVIQARQVHVLHRVPVFVSTLCHVRQGEKLVQWDNREMRAGRQDLILLPAGRELGITNKPGSLGHYIADTVTFSQEILSSFRARHGIEIHARLSHASSSDLCVPLDRHTAEAWDNLLACLASDAPQALRTHYGEGVLLALSLAGHAGPLLIDRRDPLGARVQQLLMLDPARSWTVASVAEHLHLGASTLRRRLADESSSFSHILEQVRLGLALQWLQATTRPVGEIAEACGYASASRFSIRFRHRYGLSPRALRAAQ
ncbi:MAG: helix-turn-helix transcriptional regulator [Pseudomonas sp.]|uniref:helix-turn-helix transcriptional regulator n=1 Tax=Pseudomonas sp. TaxID=306 RepID=UPI002FC5FD29